MHRLLLMVTTPTMLEKGTFPRHQFDISGGIIGSSKNATWYINNFKNELEEYEFEIKFYGGYFCLVAYSHHIFINRTTKALPKGAIIRLKNGDLISIANYDIRVKIYTEQSDNVNLQDDLFDIVRSVDNDFLLSSNSYKYDIKAYESSMEKGELLTLKKEQFELDPLMFLGSGDGEDNMQLLQSTYSDFINTQYNNKIINEYIDTNIESYEPLIINDVITDSQLSNDDFGEVIDIDDISLSRLPLDDAKQANIEKKEHENTNILDPLFFIK